jgi:N-acetylglutamate synthase-like GNAT family acetyltransferase
MTNINIDIREIKYNTEDYNQELKLRDNVLRKPLGLSLYDENLKAEKDDFHIGAYANGHLVGVLILTKQSVKEIKMRQVAVSEQWRSLKVGTALVRYAEQYAKNKGYETVLMHARKTAREFYLKLGYESVDEEFLEINIPHYCMRKSLV